MLENKIDELASMVKQLAMVQKSTLSSHSASLCGICSSIDHPTDGCPTIQDTEKVEGVPQAYAATIAKLGSIIQQV